MIISFQVLCHVVDLKHGFVTSWDNVLFTLENIGTCVKINWNYFSCLMLHKVKVFIDYAQGLVQLILLIFTSMISFFALFIFMEDGKAVNYNGNEITGLIIYMSLIMVSCKPVTSENDQKMHFES